MLTVYRGLQHKYELKLLFVATTIVVIIIIVRKLSLFCRRWLLSRNTHGEECVRRVQLQLHNRRRLEMDKFIIIFRHIPASPSTQFTAAFSSCCASCAAIILLFIFCTALPPSNPHFPCSVRFGTNTRRHDNEHEYAVNIILVNWCLET